MNYDKLGPTLAAALDEFQEWGRPALAPMERLVSLVWTEAVPKPPRVVVFVHCAEDATLEHLSGPGVEINQARGSVRTGIVDLERLEEVADDPAIERIVPARPLHLLMDVAPAKVRLPGFHQSSALRGDGVVIGIIDTGIESDHPDFAGRVDRIWDQTLSGPGVPEGGYGVELTGSMLRVSRDAVGHGTHVAGIAAGANDVFGGVAPKAHLVVVKSDLMTAHLADAVRYVFRVAGELGRPAVVNMSLGGHGDAHDGTDSLSLVIDAESGPGRVVCCAAGNEGTDDIHAQVKVRDGGTGTVFVAMGPAAGGATGRRGGPEVEVALNGWYTGSERLEVAVASPSGQQTPFQPVITNQSPARSYQLPDGRVRLVTPGPDPANGDHNFFALVLPVAPAAPNSSRGAWKLRLRVAPHTDDRVHEVTVDVWSVAAPLAQFTGRSVHDALKVGSPGAATQAVTVGAYTTKIEWFDILGGVHEAGLDLDDISDFSSEGPRRDGAEKPDLAAPGAMITSALSTRSPVSLQELIDDLHVIKAGTSQATPFVSGLVALLLERDPTLGPQSVKDQLRAASTVPGQAGGGFDPKWGYGLIDASKL